MKTNQRVTSVPIWKREFPDGEPDIPQPGENNQALRIRVQIFRVLPVLLAVVALFGETDVVYWFTRGMVLPLDPSGQVFVVALGAFVLVAELLVWRLRDRPGPLWRAKVLKGLHNSMIPLAAIELLLLLIWLT